MDKQLENKEQLQPSPTTPQTYSLKIDKIFKHSKKFWLYYLITFISQVF